jgi:hypothetical protein
LVIDIGHGTVDMALAVVERSDAVTTVTVVTDATSASALESEAMAKRHQAALAKLSALQSQLDRLVSSISCASPLGIEMR